MKIIISSGERGGIPKNMYIMLEFNRCNNNTIIWTILLILVQSNEVDSTIAVLKSTSKVNTSFTEKFVLSIKPIKNFIFTIPEDCKELGICENIPNYPHEKVLIIIRKLLKQNITFNKDIEEDYYTNNIDDASTMIHEDEDLCKSKSKLYFPQAARDGRNNWHLILNSPRTSQNFIGDQCVLKYPNCSKVAYFTNAYHGVCIQKYMKRVMYGLNDDLNGVIKTLFDVPSCCACVVRREIK